MCSMIYPQQQQPSPNQVATREGLPTARPPSPPAVTEPVSVKAGGPAPGELAKDSGVPGGAVVGSVDEDDLRLDVTCGQNQAVLYTSRLQLGSKGTCVLFENQWLTPNEFQYVSGRETAKDWKRSIKHHGKSLKVLIAKGILTTSPPARCDCGQCGVPKKDKETWKPTNGESTPLVPVDATKSSSCVATSGVDSGDLWRTTTNSGVVGNGLDGSAFRPPVENCRTTSECSAGFGARNTSDCSMDRSSSNLQALHQPISCGPFSPQQPSSKPAVTATAFDTLEDCSPDSKSKKSQKRPRSPSAGPDISEPSSKCSSLKPNHYAECTPLSPSVNGCARLSGSTEGTISGVDRTSDASRPTARQQFSPTDNHRRRDPSSGGSTSGRHSQTPQRQHSESGFKSPHQGSGSAVGFQSQKTSPATAAAALDRPPTDSACLPTQSPYVISPVAATPYYFPFLAGSTAATPGAAASQLPVCYPNPYMMLPPAYHPTSALFPYGWGSPPSAHAAAAAGITSPVKSIAEQMRQMESQQHQPQRAATGPTFDFPWMRGCVQSNPFTPKISPPIADPYEGQMAAAAAAAAAKQSFGLAAQNPYYMRGTGNLGPAAFLPDSIDAYRRSSCDARAPAVPDIQPSFFDGQHHLNSGGFGVYPPLFQSPYFGIPSR